MTTFFKFGSCKQTPIDLFETLNSLKCSVNKYLKQVFFECNQKRKKKKKRKQNMESADELELSDYSETIEEGMCFFLSRQLLVRK